MNLVRTVTEARGGQEAVGREGEALAARAEAHGAPAEAPDVRTEALAARAEAHGAPAEAPDVRIEVLAARAEAHGAPAEAPDVRIEVLVDHTEVPAAQGVPEEVRATHAADAVHDIHETAAIFLVKKKHNFSSIKIDIGEKETCIN